jgi:hypothetical protein
MTKRGNDCLTTGTDKIDLKRQRFNVSIDYNVYVLFLCLGASCDHQPWRLQTLLSSSTPFLTTGDVESLLCQGHDSKSGIYDRRYGTSLSLPIIVGCLDYKHSIKPTSSTMIKKSLLAPVLTLCFVQVISTALITFIFPFVASRKLDGDIMYCHP